MKKAIDTSNIPSIAGAKIALICPKWHADLIGMMADKCTALLESVGADVERHIIPGSMEIPYTAQALAKTGKYDALVGFGVIVKGDTWHFDMILDHVNHGISEITLKYDIPFINEILPVNDIAHAKDRAADNEFNKGIEAAVAAAEIISWRRNL